MKRERPRVFRIVLALLAALAVTITAAESSGNPVTAEYCDGTSLDIYPVSRVTRDDGSTFTCTDVRVTPVAGGIRYGFEDKDDADYNDIIVELRVSGQGSGSPAVQVTFISKDASYGHEIHLVYAGNDVTVFNADDHTPGSVFTVSLPQRACPDFSLAVDPASATAVPGGRAAATVTLTAIGGHNSPIALDCPDLPGEISASFNPAAIRAGQASALELEIPADLEPGAYTITIRGDDGSLTRTVTLSLKIRGPRVELSKTFRQNAARPGETVIMDLTARNRTGAAITRLELSDILPRGLQYVGDNAPVPAQTSGSTVSWTIPRLGMGDSVGFPVTLRLKEDLASGTLRNLATARVPSRQEPIAEARADLEVTVLEVELRKSVDRATASPGDELTYRLDVVNASSFALEGLTLRDNLPGDLVFISARGPFRLERTGGRLAWSGRLEAGEAAAVEIRARVDSTALGGTIVRNTAYLDAADLEEPLASNTVRTTVTGNAANPDSIRFTKRAPIPQTEVGRIIRFVLEVNNRSGSPLVNLFIEDPLPRGFAYVPGSATLNGLPLEDPPAISRPGWTLPILASGDSLRLVFQTVIAADARRGRHVNRARLRARDTLGGIVELEADALVYVSAGGLVFLTGIEGTVFLDRDGDGFQGPGDTPLEGIAVRLSTGEETASGRDGTYKLEGLTPGEYAVSVNPAALSERFRRADSMPRLVVLSDGLTETVDFPLRFRGEADTPLTRLEGRVFLDRDSNEKFSPGDTPLRSFRVRLDDLAETAGRDGRFVFTRIAPGAHVLVIRAEGLQHQKTVELPAGRTTLDIPIAFSGLTITVREEK